MEADRQAALIAALREMAQRAGNRIAGGGVRGAATRGFLGMDAPEEATPMQRDVYENVSRASAPVMGLAAAPMVLSKGLSAAPRAEALETARLNAVKMLGLPENNTAMDRARALGFGQEVYRGTNADERVAKLSKGMMGDAHYSGLIPGVGNDYAGTQAGANVMPLMVRGRLASNREMSDAVQDVGWGRLNEELGKRGFTGVSDTKYEMAAAMKDPSAVRSRFAAFDPARVNENDLLGRADPRLLAGLAAGAGATTAAVSALRRKKDEEKDGK